jgi:hypothetical protein
MTTGGKAPFNYCCPCLCESGRANGKLGTFSFDKMHIWSFKILDNNHYERVTTLPPSRATSRTSSGASRVRDRNVVPESRAACIDFLRSDEFASGRFRPFDCSISSRTTRVSTEDSGVNCANANGDLNRQASISHPELFEGNISGGCNIAEMISPFDSSTASTTPLVQSCKKTDSGFFCADPEEVDKKRSSTMVRTSSAPDLAAES